MPPVFAQKVSSVSRARRPLPEGSIKHAIEALVRQRVEAWSPHIGSVVEAQYHPFVAAVNDAFCDHRPLVLSPDMFWLLVVQGFARYVNHNSEAMRSRFVSHDGREKIIVRRDDFRKGSPENPWTEVLSEFSSKIKQHIGEQNHSNLVASFSTTGPAEKAACEVGLMDALQSYFEYEVKTWCGIPEVLLEGTPEDWEQLRDRTDALGKTYDLTWWTDRIVPTLARIARNASGVNDAGLWQDIYKLDQHSGGPYINGWLTDFFPYLRIYKLVHIETGEVSPNPQDALGKRDQYRYEKVEWPNPLLFGDQSCAVTTECLPAALSKAPFLWQYFDRSFQMDFVAGFVGFTQQKRTMAVRPKIGWAICDSLCDDQPG